MSEWRDKTRIPRGMSDFKRWFRPQGIDSRIMPSDADGMLHTVKGNRFIMFEFKPEAGSLTVGQRITMQGFSKLPGACAVAVYDPYSWDESRKQYADDTVLKIQVFKNGNMTTEKLTVAELNLRIAAWFGDQSRGVL